MVMVPWTVSAGQLVALLLLLLLLLLVTAFPSQALLSTWG